MLSKKTQYALKALEYLVNVTSNEPVLIAQIAKGKGIPLKFLENILLQLKRSEILISKKGKGGGYYFKVSPSIISIASVIRIIDGPIALLPCVSIHFYKRCADCDEVNCAIKKIMALARDATLTILEDKYVSDLKTL